MSQQTNHSTDQNNQKPKTSIAKASELFEEKNGELKLALPQAESHITKRLQEIYQENPEYAMFLIEHGYFFLGMEEPDQEIKELVEEGKIPDKDNYCFSTSQYAVEEVDRLQYVEGWLDDGSGVLRHGFCFDREYGTVIDLSVWNNQEVENKLNQKDIEKYYRGLNYFGVIIPQDKIDWKSTKRNQLEQYAWKNDIEKPEETLDFQRKDGKFEGKELMAE
jgi:hypothetical protein